MERVGRGHRVYDQLMYNSLVGYSEGKGGVAGVNIQSLGSRRSGAMYS